jgi:hypothetical protein
VTCRIVQMVAAADPDDREHAALRRGQLTSSQAEARQNHRIDSTGVTEGDPVRPYRPSRKKKVTRRRPNRQRGPPGPVPPYSEDDSGWCGQTGAVPGGYSGRAALRRGQCDILGLDDISIVT